MRPPLWIFALSGLTDFQKLVAVVLWTHANADNIEGGCALVWPRVKTVVGELGRDSRGRERTTSAVHRAVRALAAHGVLERKSVTVGGREIPGFALQVDRLVTPSDQPATDSDRLDTVTGGSRRECQPVTSTAPAGHPDSTGRSHHKNDNRTTTEHQGNDKTSTAEPLALIPDEHVQRAPTTYERVANALCAARRRAYHGERKRIELTPLTATRRKHVDGLLREGYTVDQIERALRRKGEEAFRSPTYRAKRQGAWRDVDSRPLVSIEHLVRRDRSTKALKNLERLLADESLDDVAPERVRVDAAGYATRGCPEPSYFEGVDYGQHEEVPGCRF